jgi:hypothetical protein
MEGLDKGGPTSGCCTIEEEKEAEVTGCWVKLHKEVTVQLSIYLSIYLWLYSPLSGLGHLFNFLIFHTIGRTPWTRDQPVAIPLTTHRTTQT